MTAALARRIAFWALVAWGLSMLLLVLFGDFLPGPEAEVMPELRIRPDIATAAGAILLAAGTALLLSWVTSMVAGPWALVKLGDRPDKLGVYKTIVLPLSLAVGLLCAIALPVKWTEGCQKHTAVVPFVTAPIYLLGDPDRAPVAYLRLPDIDRCDGA